MQVLYLFCKKWFWCILSFYGFACKKIEKKKEQYRQGKEKKENNILGKERRKQGKEQGTRKEEKVEEETRRASWLHLALT